MAEVQETNVKALLERFKWKRITAPRSWRPKEAGEELIGYYGGRTVRNGSWGQYDVVLVHVPVRGTMMISGVMVVQPFDAAMIDIGHPVRIVWNGMQDVGEDRRMKSFSVFVAEGDVIAESDLPRVQ
jgi:hypothetical protein